MHQRTRETIRRWGPYLLATLWLGLGYANLIRGLAHPAVAYRPWAFDHHSYSDLLAMTGDRYLGGGHPIPYLEDRIEYPVLLGFFLWAPSFLPGGQWSHFTTSYLLLSACLMGSIAVLQRLGASAGWLAGTPAIAYYAGLNWDLFPILLLLLSVLLAERNRMVGSGAIAALGVSAKLWPVAILPALGGALVRRDGPALLRLVLTFGLVVLFVNLPFALLAPDNWSWFFRFNAQRGPDNSIWEAVGVSDLRLLAVSNLASVLIASAIAAVAAYRTAEGQVMRLGTALILVTWITTNKVWSPQYVLYGFAAAALVSAPARLFFALSVVAVVDYHLAFEVRSSRGLFSFSDRVYYGEEWLRTAVLILLLSWIGRELWRATHRVRAVE